MTFTKVQPNEIGEFTINSTCLFAEVIEGQPLEIRRRYSNESYTSEKQLYTCPDFSKERDFRVFVHNQETKTYYEGESIEAVGTILQVLGGLDNVGERRFNFSEHETPVTMYAPPQALILVSPFVGNYAIFNLAYYIYDQIPNT